MPSTSEKQRRFMGMELGKLRKGQKTDVKMSESDLEDFARKPIARSTSRKTYRNSSR
jgi:hypothetical protein